MSTAAACARHLLDAILPLVQTIRQEMRRGRGKGLSVPQFRTLAMVRHHPGASLSDVAALVGLGAPAMSVLVQGLVRKRLLVRAGADGDRRRSLLHLTAAGQRVLARAHASTSAMLAGRFKALSGAELATLASAVALLRRTFPHPTAAADAPQEGAP